MLSGDKKKLNRIWHGLDGQREVDEVEALVFHDFIRRPVMLDICSPIQAACARDRLLQSAAPSDEPNSTFSFKALKGWNMSDASKPAAADQRNTRASRHSSSPLETDSGVLNSRRRTRNRLSPLKRRCNERARSSETCGIISSITLSRAFATIARRWIAPIIPWRLF
jgi:hypothetical protein